MQGVQSRYAIIQRLLQTRLLGLPGCLLLFKRLTPCIEFCFLGRKCFGFCRLRGEGFLSLQFPLTPLVG